jgi:hypothetical protein
MCFGEKLGLDNAGGERRLSCKGGLKLQRLLTLCCMCVSHSTVPSEGREANDTSYILLLGFSWNC